MRRKPQQNISTRDAQQMNGLPSTSVAAYDSAVTLSEPSIKMLDSFSNPVARLGFGTQNLLEATEYPLTRMTQNYALLNSLYRNNWVIQNIVGAIPEDITKKWFRIVTKAPSEYIDKFDRMQRQTKLRKSVLEGMKWGRLYGGAVGLILIAGQEDMLEEPLNYDTIQPDSFKGLYIVDRWSGVYPDMQIITDINDTDFGLPEYYEVRNEHGVMTQRVHHSRVVRFIGRELPYYEKIVEQYWGQSEIEAIYEEIVKRDNVSNNIASLTFKANLSVYEMDNLDQIFAVGGGAAQKRFWNSLQAQSILESNMGTRVINKGDSIQNLQYTFTGLAEIYSNIMMDVSGAARIPVTKLFGRSPGGMNATGESDLQNYYDYIDELRESDFRPIIEKLLPVMALSAWGEIPDDLNFIFESVKVESDSEKSSIAQRKVASLIEVFNANGMTQEAFMKELKALSESTGMFANITDEMIAEGVGVWARDLQAMNDPFAGLMPGGMNEFDMEGPEPSADLGNFTKGSKIQAADTRADLTKIKNNDKNPFTKAVKRDIINNDGGPGSGRKPEGGSEEKTSFGSGFRGKEAKEHLERRQREGHYKDLNEEQYQEKALDLLQSEVGGDIDGYETERGKVVRWNKTTGDYATGIPGERVKTMFPLRGGQARFDKLKQSDNKEP